MKIFVAAGVVFEGSRQDARLVKDWLHLYRKQHYLLLMAREAGDLGLIVRHEHWVEQLNSWINAFLVGQRSCDEEALDIYLAAEKRYIRERSEHCLWCWYGRGDAPEAVRDAPGSVRVPAWRSVAQGRVSAVNSRFPQSGLPP